MNFRRANNPPVLGLNAELDGEIFNFHFEIKLHF